MDFITDSGGQWEEHTVDLSAYAGQMVVVRFHVNTLPAVSAYLDDITLSSHP